jgi:hypothetical protein
MSLSENPEITNNLKIIYDNINKRINELLIEKIKEVAIEALRKIKPTAVSEEDDEEEDDEKENIDDEEEQKSIILSFQNNSTPLLLPDKSNNQNSQILTLQNNDTSTQKQQPQSQSTSPKTSPTQQKTTATTPTDKNNENINPIQNPVEQVQVKDDEKKGGPPDLPDFPGVYYYVFPGQGVWPDKNYPFSDSNTQTGGGNQLTPNAVNTLELHKKYSTVYKKYEKSENNQNLYNVDINDSIENLYHNRKEVIKLYNMYYYMNINTINKNNNVNIANKVVDTKANKRTKDLYEKSSEYKFLLNQDNTNIIDFSST